MLPEMFPKAYTRYRSLLLLGPILDDFAQWLQACGYAPTTRRDLLKRAVILDQLLRNHGVQRVIGLDPEVLRTCWVGDRRRQRPLSSIARVLAHYLRDRGLLGMQAPARATPSQTLVGTFVEHLRHVRGFARSTVRNHARTASQFLKHLGLDTSPNRLLVLGQGDLETFLLAQPRTLKRASLQQMVAHLRGFLRYLASHALAPAGLSSQIDTPRLYRLEQLPRTLPWETVCALLESIDQSSPTGVRDHAVLFLIATYGLRVSEIATLTLDDIHWRQGWIRVNQRKIGASLDLPLTESAGAVLFHYLREGRPTNVACRELFLRSRAPIGPMGGTAVSMIFERWAKRSGLDIRYFGAHCLRHAYAVHLLQRGVPLKTLGDLLGHHTAESTCVYLRLAAEQLREVALAVPPAVSPDVSEEAQS